MEARGSSRCLAILKFKFGKSFMAEDIGAEEVNKMAFVPEKIEQKGKLSMEPMVESSWKSIDYSAPAEESISLVGKYMGMTSTTSSGFTPQTIGVS